MTFVDTDTSPPRGSVRDIEIHFDERSLDQDKHPVVPIRWCISENVISEMRKHPERDWALVVVAQKPGRRDEDAGVNIAGDRTHETRLVIEGFRAISVRRGFMTFVAPGQHEVVAYLVHSGYSDGGRASRSLFWKAVQAFSKLTDRKMSYANEIDLFENDGETVNRSLDGVSTFATDHVRISVPEQIFAKPLPEWLRKQFELFGLDEGINDCATRWRAVAAYTVLPVIGAIVVALMFTVTRLWLFILGILHFLVGGTPMVPWKEIFQEQIAPDFSTFWMTYRYKRYPIFNGAGAFFVPLVLIIIGGLSWAAVTFTDFGWYILAGLVALLLGLYTLAVTSDALDEHFAKQSKKSRQDKVLADIALVERYAVCGEQTTSGPRTIELVFSGIKRSLCKPRQRRYAG